MNQLLRYREDIADSLSRQVKSSLNDLGRINAFAPELMQRLEDYALRGKLIRGSLVPYTFDLLGGLGGERNALFDIAAAIELFQSMLLIHDDIMDQDELRRGKPSIHAQYASDGRHLKLGDPDHYGVSLGICAGDVSAFIAFGILSRLNIDDAIKGRLISFIADEMVLVGVAQMQDVHHGEAEPSSVSLDAVERMYRYKTGRYTFSLAMSIGALLAGRDDSLRERLEEFGELLGIIFQIKDDEIGLYGFEEKTGKPLGSDLYEGKKTVYMQTLLEETAGDIRSRLERLLGNISGPEDVSWIMGQIDKHGIRDRVSGRLDELAGDCSRLIDEMGEAETDLAAGMRWLLEYNLNRDF
jgi:geranylgeranyl diphosphate synthase type I